MKPKDKIYLYEIKFDFHDNKVIQKKEEYTVLGVNNTYLVINDFSFTSLKHSKLYRGDRNEFNVPYVYESNFSTYWDYIEGSLYTASASQKVAYKRIKKELEKYIYKKHGRYCNAASMLNKIEI